MWLLKTEDFEDGDGPLTMIYAWDDTVPPYAILSHRWARDPSQEVSFADVQHLLRSQRSGKLDDFALEIKSKLGYQKLSGALQKACSEGWRYIWIDTCCIDKSSSAELSEAINSMYRFYSNARICYAYLQDVDSESQLMDSEYFTREWTLQELLAPKKVLFLNRSWEQIATKHSHTTLITLTTAIPEYYLRGELPVQQASIAERMSWAAHRKLSRAEDTAYCLLGIFEINLSLLYGEGKQKAFLRLQEEILKQSTDHSIFAWTKQNPAGDLTLDMAHGMLADGPEDFRLSSNIRPCVGRSTAVHPTMTAKGLLLELPLTWTQEGTFLAGLNCLATGQSCSGYVAITLRKIEGEAEFVRIRCFELLVVDGLGAPERLHVVQNVQQQEAFRTASRDRLVQITWQSWYSANCKYVSHTMGRLSGQPKSVSESTESPMRYLVNLKPRTISAAFDFQHYDSSWNPKGRPIRLLVGSMSGLQVGCAFELFSSIGGQMYPHEWHQLTQAGFKPTVIASAKQSIGHDTRIPYFQGCVDVGDEYHVEAHIYEWIPTGSGVEASKIHVEVKPRDFDGPTRRVLQGIYWPSSACYRDHHLPMIEAEAQTDA